MYWGVRKSVLSLSSLPKLELTTLRVGGSEKHLSILLGFYSFYYALIYSVYFSGFLVYHSTEI